jgi:hypothetical protein
MKCRTIGLLLGLSLIACIPALAAGDIYLVGPPSGGDDTAILQAALDYGASHPGCVLQLSPGKFLTKQLLIDNFRGTIKGMGMGKTTIEALPELPVTQDDPFYFSPHSAQNLWPILMQFTDGDVFFSDLAITFPAAKATQDYIDYSGPDKVTRNILIYVLRVTGQSANLTLNRVKMEGGLAAQMDPDYGRLNHWMVVDFEPLNFPGTLSGTLSVTASVFLNNSGSIQAFALDTSKVTIGGSPSASNLFQDVEQPVYLQYFENSSSEVSHNNMVRTNWVGIGLNQACCGPSQTSSKFVVQHNNITVLPTYGSYYGYWWPDGIDLIDYDWPPDYPQSVKSEFVVSDNTIQLANDTGAGVYALQDAGSIIANNRISGTGWAALFLDGSTRDTLIGNNVQHHTSEVEGMAPITLWFNTSLSTVVGGPNAANAVDWGANNTLVGVNNMRGNPPGPAVLDALKRKMKLVNSVCRR